MKTPVLFFLSFFLAAVFIVSGQTPGVADPGTTPQPTLQARLYDTAGALGNEGFKLRDGAWSGMLEGSKARRLAVNLFAGNQYWFCAATSGADETPDLILRDPTGARVETVPYEGAGVAAVGVTAPVTGRYIVELRGSAAGSRDFCLLYLFK